MCVCVGCVLNQYLKKKKVCCLILYEKCDILLRRFNLIHGFGATVSILFTRYDVFLNVCIIFRNASAFSEANRKLVRRYSDGLNIAVLICREERALAS